MKRHLKLVAPTAVALSLTLAACGARFDTVGKPTLERSTDPGAKTSADARAASKPASAYEALYPTYAEFCAVSQIKKKPHHGVPVEGGYGGHGLMYIKGACRDTSAKYPRIKMCDPKEGGEQGVGISLNSDFKNVGWIAVQDHDLLYNGLLRKGETVNSETYTRAMKRARDLKVMDGVEFWQFPEERRKSPEGLVDNTEFVWQDSFGTDFAVRFARSMYCARIPLDGKDISKMVHYLNSRNEYYLSGRDYVFSGTYDNCTHLTHNAIASTGFWDSYETNQFLPVQLFNMAIPYNDWATMLKQGNDLDLEDIEALYSDKVVRNSLLVHGHLPTRPGVVGGYTHIHEPNELYETDKHGLILELPLIRPIRADMKRMLNDKRYTQVRANLESFRGRYERALKRVGGPQIRFNHGNSGEETGRDSRDLLLFIEKYKEYLVRQVAYVDAQLSKLAAYETEGFEAEIMSQLERDMGWTASPLK